MDRDQDCARNSPVTSPNIAGLIPSISVRSIHLARCAPRAMRLPSRGAMRKDEGKHPNRPSEASNSESEAKAVKKRGVAVFIHN